MIHQNDVPIVGSGKNMLGVRVPPDPNADILPDADGNVLRDTGGMSVAPNWRNLPYFLIPKRLKAFVPDARGRNELACFQFGEGAFAESVVSEELVLKPNSSFHATIQPAHSMPLTEYQEAIAATRDGWVRDEA